MIFLQSCSHPFAVMRCEGCGDWRSEWCDQEHQDTSEIHNPRQCGPTFCAWCSDINKIKEAAREKFQVIIDGADKALLHEEQKSMALLEQNKALLEMLKLAISSTCGAGSQGDQEAPYWVDSASAAIARAEGKEGVA